MATVLSPHTDSETVESGLHSISRVMGLVFLVAFLVRIVYVFAFRESVFFKVPMVDAQWHDAWGWGWAEGTWDMGGRAFFRAPLYPFFLSLVYRVLGHDLIAVRVVQAVLGAVTAAALAGCGWRIGGRRMALWAGGIAALYGPLIYFDAELLIPTLLIALLSWALFFLLAPPSRSTCLISGLLLGLAVIARPTVLVVLPVAFFFLWKRIRAAVGLPKGLIVGAVLLSLLPAAIVTVINAVEEKTFVFIASQGGVNFYAGNHGKASGRSIEIVELEPAQNSWADLVEASYQFPSEETGRTLNSREVSAYWTRKALRWIASDPVGAFKLTAKKAYYVFNAYEAPNNRDLYLDRPFPLNLLLWKTPIFAFPWGLVFPLAVMGIFVGLGTADRRHTFALLTGWLALYALILIPFFVCARFRMGLLPTVILLAAFTVSHWRNALKGGPLTAGIVTLILVNTAFFQARAENPSQELLKRGVVSLGVGRVSEARRDLEKAVELNPRSAKSAYALGEAYLLEGNNDFAKHMFVRSLNLGASNHRILSGIGQALLRLEAYDEAAVALDRLVKARPKDTEAWLNLGQAYEYGGRHDKAIEAYHAVIDIAPGEARGYLGLGSVYQQKGDLTAAIDVWRAGARLASGSFSLHYNLALAYAQIGQYESGLQAIDKALELKPNDPEAFSLRELLVEETKQTE